MLPTSTRGGDTDDDIEGSYAGMVTFHIADSNKCDEWILDSGASDHMTGSFSMLSNVSSIDKNQLINLPTGETSKITHRGFVGLENDIKLKNVLYIPAFKQNLLSVHKLCQDNGCKVLFHDKYCIIQDNVSDVVKGVGRCENGLYYLVNETVGKILNRVRNQTLNTTGVQVKRAMTASLYQGIPSVIENVPRLSKETIWHHRLGHAPMKRIMQIDALELKGKSSDICVTCPLAKFTKLPFNKSQSRTSRPF